MLVSLSLLRLLPLFLSLFSIPPTHSLCLLRLLLILLLMSIDISCQLPKQRSFLFLVLSSLLLSASAAETPLPGTHTYTHTELCLPPLYRSHLYRSHLLILSNEEGHELIISLMSTLQDTHVLRAVVCLSCGMRTLMQDCIRMR